MPIYEYACPDCGHRFEEIQRISADPIRVCPKCSQENVRKLVSTTSFVLKGEGWYKDHYGLKSGGESSGSSTTTSSSSTSSAPATEAAPAAPAPAAPAAPAAPSSGSSS